MQRILLYLKKKNKKAFTLVEVLLAIAILGLVATPILQVFYSSLNVNQRSQKLLDAADLVDGTLEFISSNTFDDFSVTPPGSTSSFNKKGIQSYYWGPNDEPMLNVAKQDHLVLYNGAFTHLYPGGPNCTYSNLCYYPDNAAPSAIKGMQLCCGNVKYNNSDYCVRIIVEGDTACTDAYFTYKVTVEVYDGHYNAAGVAYQQSNTTLNTNETFNYGTINAGYYDLLCSGFTYIQNKY